MGQAAVDLPDPLEKPAAAQTASADDLLAQLAGDEIDRLLAESDAGAATAPMSATPSGVLPEPAAKEVDLSADVDDADARKFADEIANDAHGKSKIPADHIDGQTEQSERSALAGVELSIPAAGLSDVSTDLPLILKPLGWLNAPLNYCPEVWREVIGKIGILTMVNAIAVLAYVILFRRHH